MINIKKGRKDLIIIFVARYWHHKWLTENIFYERIQHIDNKKDVKGWRII